MAQNQYQESLFDALQRVNELDQEVVPGSAL